MVDLGIFLELRNGDVFFWNDDVDDDNDDDDDDDDADDGEGDDDDDECVPFFY